MRLKDKVAIVTGSGAGIGKSIAEVFAQEGASVVGASRRSANGQPVVDEIVTKGGKAIFIKCDVSIEADVKTLIGKTVAEYGRIDVLVNNAGVNFVKPFDQLDSSDWDRVINTDLRGTFLCSMYAIKPMLEAGVGSIVNVGTVHTM